MFIHSRFVPAFCLLAAFMAVTLRAQTDGVEVARPQWGLIMSSREGDVHALRVTELPQDGRLDLKIGRIAMAYTRMGAGENRQDHRLPVEYGPNTVFVHVPKDIIQREGDKTTYYGAVLHTPTSSGQNKGGEILLLAKDASIRGSTPKLKRQFDHHYIDDWTSLDDGLSWSFTSTRTGVYEVLLTYACDAGEAQQAGEYVVTAGDESAKGVLKNTKGSSLFMTTTAGRLRINSTGKQTISLAATKKVGAKVMSLKSLALLPVPESGNVTVTRPERDGSLMLTARAAQIQSTVLQWDGRPHRQSIGNWTEAGGVMSWRVWIDKPGAYEVELMYACGKGQAGSDMAVFMMPEDTTALDGGRVTFVTEENTAGSLFDRRSVGVIPLRTSGYFEVTLLCRKVARTTALDLRQIRLVPTAGPVADGGSGVDDKSPAGDVTLRYKFADGHRESYAVRMETGDDRDRRVREGNVTYQFSAPSSFGFTMEIVPSLTTGRTLAGSSPVSAQQILGSDRRLQSGPIKFDSSGDASEASTVNRTRPIPGDLQSLIIIPLPQKPAKSWTRESTINLTYPTRGGQTRTVKATEEHTFTIDKMVDDSVAVARTMRLATQEQVNGKPMWELTLKGQVVLGREGGLPLEGEWAGEITQRDDRGEFRTPFRESFRRLGEKVMREMAEQEAKRKAESEKTFSEMDRVNKLKEVPVALRQTIDAGRLAALLADLKSKDAAKVDAAVEALLKSKPVAAKKFDVLPVLRGLRRSELSTFASFGVMHLEEVWASAAAETPGKNVGPTKLSAEQVKQMNELIAELSVREVSRRRAAAERLEQYPDERAAAALAKAMSDPFLRSTATNALKNMGPLAADHVLQHLEGRDHFLTSSAIEVLQAQGTAKHVPAMRKRLEGERDLILERELKDAIAAASGR